MKLLGVQGDLLLCAAGPPAVVNAALDKVRQFLAAELKEIPADSHAITWITDWPMFETSEESGRLQVKLFLLPYQMMECVLFSTCLVFPFFCLILPAKADSTTCQAMDVTCEESRLTAMPSP